MKKNISIKEAEKELKKRYSKATEILEDDDKIERFFQKLEKKLKVVPLAGDQLSNIPVMASLVRSYYKKEYTEIPVGSIISIISALIYFVSPIDLIPDNIPIIGYLDDAAVVAACWKLVESDVIDYNEWRHENNKMLDI